jgi:hypothetical protein
MRVEAGGNNLVGETFGENLPHQCPPELASDLELTNVFRLVGSSEPDDSCFKSKQALGISKPTSYNSSDCEWASCSLSSSIEALLKIRGLRKRLKYVAKLDIPAKSGRHLKENTHIHFWRFASFNVANAVKEVSEHGQS